MQDSRDSGYLPCVFPRVIGQTVVEESRERRDRSGAELVLSSIALELRPGRVGNQQITPVGRACAPGGGG